ncbi:hypothetical protein [Sphingomonas sp. CLY1604]|uniref:hypothetical protein n=1 Tax=Sphingomonas sp. CLY1604 TaxID=3457786 RepID=UPI003FD7CE69
MSRILIGACIGALCLSAAAVPAAAQNAASFSGTWKGDIASAKLPAKPDVFMLKDGRYSCSSCVPAVAVKADGTAQASPGHDYWDHIAVKPVDARTIAYRYTRGGKVVTTSTDTVSPDGRTLTSRWRSTDNAKGVEQSGTKVETRIGPAPAGAHAASGSWRREAIKAISDSSLYLTLKDDGRALTFSQPSGETFTARFGGPAVPIVGDPARTMAQVRRAGPRTIVETDTRDGKVVYVYTMTLAPDGRSITMVNEDRRQGTKTQFVAHRQ